MNTTILTCHARGGDAARGEGHFLDLLWGGFPGADAPSIGTEKTVYTKPK